VAAKVNSLAGNVVGAVAADAFVTTTSVEASTAHPPATTASTLVRIDMTEPPSSSNRSPTIPITGICVERPDGATSLGGTAGVIYVSTADGLAKTAARLDQDDGGHGVRRQDLTADR
jgi:hypothetical protein